MTRRLTYPPEATPQKSARTSFRTRSAQPQTRDLPQGVPPGQDEVADQYREKLVKYVPAEAIAFFTLGFAALKPNSELADGWYVALVVVGLLIAWMFAAGTAPDAPPLPWWSYGLTFVAFIAWTIGTTGIAPIIFESWPSGVSDFILAAAIFLVPGADLRLTRRRVSLALDAAADKG